MKLSTIIVFMVVFVIWSYFMSRYLQSKQKQKRFIRPSGYEEIDSVASRFNNTYANIRHNFSNYQKLVDNINWLLQKGDHRNIDVKRIMIQDMNSVAEMGGIFSRFEIANKDTIALVDEKLGVVAKRIDTIKHKKDKETLDKLYLEASMIRG